MTTRSLHKRPGYTLVEVMVALGLSVLTMWILAEAFRIGLEMIGQARAQANLMTQLAAVGAILQRDLVYAHPFLPDDSRPNRGLRLSDQRVDLLPSGRWTPPLGGFFRIVAPPPGLTVTDTEGLNIYTVNNHALHFTAILPERETNLFRVTVPADSFSPGGTYESRAAEIAYFLVDTNTRTSGGTNPLYNLVRRQRLVAVNAAERTRLDTSQAGMFFNDLIASQIVPPGSPTTAYTLQGIRVPSNRFPIDVLPISEPVGTTTLPRLVFPPVSNPNLSGEEILLPNVLSFEVMVHWQPHPPNGTAAPTDNPYAFLPPPHVFDTGHDLTTVPLHIRVLGIQVTIRAYDPKTRAVRQNTWRFAL